MEYGDWPGAGKGLPLPGNVFAVTWEGSGKAVKAHRRVLCRDAAAGQRVRGDLGRQWQSGKCPQSGFVS